MHCALPAPYTPATVEGTPWKEALGLYSLLYHLSHARNLNSQVSSSHPSEEHSLGSSLQSHLYKLENSPVSFTLTHPRSVFRSSPSISPLPWVPIKLSPETGRQLGKVTQMPIC